MQKQFMVDVNNFTVLFQPLSGIWYLDENHIKRSSVGWNHVLAPLCHIEFLYIKTFIHKFINREVIFHGVGG